MSKIHHNHHSPEQNTICRLFVIFFSVSVLQKTKHQKDDDDNNDDDYEIKKKTVNVEMYYARKVS